jgi:hypothetical protein
VLAAIEGTAGVTAIDTSPGATVRLKDPPIAPDFALTEQLPAASAVTTPEVVIVATALFVEAQVTDVVRSFLLPSL